MQAYHQYGVDSYPAL